MAAGIARTMLSSLWMLLSCLRTILPFLRMTMAKKAVKPAQSQPPVPVQSRSQSRFVTDFDIQGHLGAGASGSVWKCLSKVDRQVYAIKKIFINKNRTRSQIDRVPRETVCMAQTCHINVIRYHTAWVEKVVEELVTPHDSPDKAQGVSVEENGGDANSSSLLVVGGISEATGEGLDEVSKKLFSDDAATQSLVLLGEDNSSSLEEPRDDDDVASKSLLLQHACDSGTSTISTSKTGSSSSGNTGSSSTGSFGTAPPNVGRVLYIQMEYCPKKLTDYLCSRKKQHALSSHRSRWVLEIARALHHLHEHGIIHRDLAPKNIMLDEDLIIKVADFGLAKNTSGQASSGMVGTRIYIAPEVELGAAATSKVDLYALGVIIFELWLGEYNVLKRHTIMEKLRNGQLPAEDGPPGEVGALMRRLLSHDPGARPTAEDVCSFFSSEV